MTNAQMFKSFSSKLRLGYVQLVFVAINTTRFQIQKPLYFIDTMIATNVIVTALISLVKRTLL